MRVLGLAISTLGLLILGCGSSAPPARAESATPATVKPTSPQPRSAPARNTLPVVATPPARAAAPPSDLPQTCTGEGKDCYPPEDFVHLLCQKKYPGVALKMFARNAPWQHGFIKVRDVAAHNAHGGPSANTRLEFLEEVILLRVLPNRYREMMSDRLTIYDVFRFDGTCSTLAEDEFMTKKPVLPPRYAPFVWSQMDPAIRRALTQDPNVEKARLNQTELCHGSILTGGNKACREATQQLARAMLNAATNGPTLPIPEDLPEWPAIRESRATADR